MEAVAGQRVGQLHRGKPGVARDDAVGAEPGLDEPQRGRRRVPVLVVPLLVAVPLLALADLESDHHAGEGVGRRLELDAERLGLARHEGDLGALGDVALALLPAPRAHRLVHGDEPARVELGLARLVELVDQRPDECPRVLLERRRVGRAEGHDAPDALEALPDHAVLPEHRRRHDGLGDGRVGPELLERDACVQGGRESVAPPLLELGHRDLAVDRVRAEQLGVRLVHDKLEQVVRE
mmetsp:Transcript_26861/g.86774  ORF Transcript_26861/g.86774 Transcript_26861/m.86774 type:complete len:238 (-) Transcript_26861:170-883(-)